MDSNVDSFVSSSQLNEHVISNPNEGKNLYFDIIILHTQ
eukprot:SAG22_NODE_881_length_6693_cov_15.416288_5_plen_39_part_00